MVHAGTVKRESSMFSYNIQCNEVWIHQIHTHTLRKHTRCVIEAGADTLSANSRAGWGLFNQDILQPRKEEAAGRDLQASQTPDTHCISTCNQKESAECKQDFWLVIYWLKSEMVRGGGAASGWAMMGNKLQALDSSTTKQFSKYFG